jgi:3,4-dihydroxy 2-butanone 4-phosphate synthase/GTP cyclohydrolase II
MSSESDNEIKFHSIPEAIEDIKAGKMVIILDDEDRENEGDLMMAADLITPEDVHFMAKYGRGLICTPLTKTRAEQLNLPLMVDQNNSSHHTAFTISVDAMNGGTGISAKDRALTVKLLASDGVTQEDFMRPGHIFPLIAKSGGVMERPGHTEAAVDLSILAGRSPVGVICEILDDDGTMARRDRLFEMANEWDLKIITIKDLIDYKKDHIVKTKLPTKYGDFEIMLFDQDGQEHVALMKDNGESKTPMVRVHSECLTGDLFGSLRCDCGAQLQKSLEKINEYGRGAVIYLRQEGRGIGLANKLKAYQWQDKGLDTIEANHQLGLESDLRSYEKAGQILKTLGWSKIQLITNNPNKIEQLQNLDIEIEQRLPLEVSPNKVNFGYLLAKQQKMGHFLDLENLKEGPDAGY